MKNRLKTTFCIFLALMFSLEKVSADELVKHNLSANYGVESIIRNYNTNTDIVCDRHLGSPSFTMYIDGVSTVNCLEVDMFDVLDFEIYKNRVFFCGKYNTGSGIIGRIGYFDLGGFSSATNVQVYYLDIPWIKEFRAMELAYFAMKSHMLLIGDGIENEQIMLDFIDEGPFWNVNSTEIYNDSLRLSDLAVSNSYVIVTSTMVKSQSKDGLLWFFSKPTAAGASIFQSTDISYENIGPNFSPDVFVRTRNDNYFVVAHTPWEPSGSPDIYLTWCLGKIIVHRGVLSEPTNVKHLYMRDVAVENNHSIVHLLINMENSSGIPCSIVYEILINLSISTLPAYGHSYNGVYATSLNLHSDLSHGVASGFGCINGNPYVLKYMPHAYGCGCLPSVQNEMRKLQFSCDPNKIVFPRAMEQMVPVSYLRETKAQEVKVDCFVPAKNQE